MQAIDRWGDWAAQHTQTLPSGRGQASTITTASPPAPLPTEAAAQEAPTQLTACDSDVMVVVVESSARRGALRPPPAGHARAFRPPPFSVVWGCVCGLGQVCVSVRGVCLSVCRGR
jgi:hypothetical protein